MSLLSWLSLVGVLMASVSTAAQSVPVDLSAYRREAGVEVQVQGHLVRVDWPVSAEETALLELNLQAGEPLFHTLGLHRRGEPQPRILLREVHPVTYLTVGTRDLNQQGWNAFFDNPPRRPHETQAVLWKPTRVRVHSQGRRTSLLIDELTAGTFRGFGQITFYPGCPLLHVEAVLSTQEEARAILYDAGLSSRSPAWTSVFWVDNQDQPHLVPTTAATPAEPLAVRQRTVVVSNSAGSVAVFPPPHQFLYPLDFSNNFKLVWAGRGYRGQTDTWGFGVRQPPEGDGRFVPWINAPPGTRQRLGVFYHLSSQGPAETLEQVRRWTHGDRFVRLPGYRTFTSHYHVEHTLELLKRGHTAGSNTLPQDLVIPAFVTTFRAHGVDIVHLAEFHVRHTPDMIAHRLEHLKLLHDECRRLSDENFLLLPGEEPNVHLGGHWISLFPRPVYWHLHPTPEMPFATQVDGYGTVYAVHNAADVLRLMEKEQGLMWTAHPRTKSSFGYPDRYREQDFYRSDRFLGAAWKAMPADLSLPKLGLRVLDLFDDMNNWGPRKQVLGEVDVFHVHPDHELYGHMNINYLRLDRLPRFDDGWLPIVEALRHGRFFVSTGEVLIPEFRVGGRASGEVLTVNGPDPVRVVARVQWTFPPAFAEIIWGDGSTVHRSRIDLGEYPAFSETVLDQPLTLSGAKWVRLEVWDIAANGAFTQPVWVD